MGNSLDVQCERGAAARGMLPRRPAGPVPPARLVPTFLAPTFPQHSTAMGRKRSPQKTQKSAAGDAQGALPRDLFLLDPEVVFLNHGSFGATPRPVFEQYQAWQRELERQPVEFVNERASG